MVSAGRTKYTLSLISFVVLLPLLIAALGFWEFSREETSVGSLSQRQIEIVQTIQSLRDLKAKNPLATVEDETGKKYSVSLAISMFEQDLADAASFSFLNPHLLPFATMGLGLTSALVGCFGLLSIQSMGRRARRSRADLLKSFQRGQKLLPWLLALLGFSVITGLACAIIYETLHYLPDILAAKKGAKLLIAAALAVLILIFYAFKLVWDVIKSSRAAFERSPLHLLGRSISEADAPELWRFVRQVAKKAKATMPDRIVVGLDQCFFVTENQVVLANGETLPPGRMMYLPLPYMAFMTEEETAAVIGHELGHFTGEDTEYSLRFSPIYASAVHNLRAVDTISEGNENIFDLVTSKPTLMLGEYFLSSFDHAVQHWSRIREFAADAMGASVASGRDIVSSLLRISVLEPHVNGVLRAYWERGGRETEGTSTLEALRQRVREHGFNDPAEHLEQTQTHPTDSHPSLRQRMEALSIAPTAELLESACTRHDSGLLCKLGLEAGSQPETESEGGEALPLRTSITQTLETEFAQKARENQEEEVRTLRAMEAAGAETRALHEGGWWTRFLLLLMGGFFLFIAVAATASTLGKLSLLGLGDGMAVENQIDFQTMITHPRGSEYVILGFFLIGLFFLTWLVIIQIRRGKPVLTLNTKGILVGAPAVEIPWTAIEDYGVTELTTNYSSTLTLLLTLSESCTPPTLSGDRRVKHLKKERKIRITVPAFRKLSSAAFAELFGRYLAAGRAREELKRRT